MAAGAAAPVAASVHVARWTVRAVFTWVFVLPVGAALLLALTQAADASAWTALRGDPQTGPAWRLAVGTAVSSSVIALLLAMAATTYLHGSRWWPRMASALAPMLAVPHAAFAIGIAWLVMPAGVAARLVAPLAGWTSPPAWASVNDPHGVALVSVLVLKELPFLLWNIVALLARPELAAQIEHHRVLARTLGYRVSRLWWRVLWPLLLPRLAWPLLAVLAYSLSVVDVAIVIGPLAPPTLAVLAWQSLLDGDPAMQALGAAQVALLASTLAGLVLVAASAIAGWRRLALRWAGSGWRGAAGRRRSPLLRYAGAAAGAAPPAIYAVVLPLLAIGACAGPWPFPALLPSSWQGDALWQAVAGSTFSFSAGLAAAASLLALLLALAWLESTPPRWDAVLMPLLLTPLAIPPLLLMVGLYRGALALALDGGLTGLLWVHVIVVLPYSVIVLAPAWRSFDPRFETTALALGRRRPAFWWRVKWPMLRAPLAAALAVGFAVALAQYLPTLFVGAGRFATLTTEAVTLSAGGQRRTAAAYALWQVVLPLLGFALAAWVRRRAVPQTVAAPTVH